MPVHVIFLRDGKILPLRRFGTGFKDGNYGLIGGHLDGNETIKQAAVRECREEAGLSVLDTELDVIRVEHYTSASGEGIDVYCKAQSWQGEAYARAECDRVDWFKLEALPQNMIPFMPDAVARYLSGQTWFCEVGWNDVVPDARD